MTEEQPRRPAVFDEAFLTDVPDVSEILLIRHGQQIEPAPGMKAGEWVDPPLSERGQQQAELLGRALSTTHFDAIYASPLSRASETAAAVARHQQLDVTTIAGPARDQGLPRRARPTATCSSSSARTC